MIHHSEKVAKINAALYVSPSYDFVKQSVAAASKTSNSLRFKDGWAEKRRNVKNGDAEELKRVYDHLKPGYTLVFGEKGHVATGRDNYQNISGQSRNAPGYQAKNRKRTRTSGVYWWVPDFEIDGVPITATEARKRHNEGQRELQDVRIGEFFLGEDADAN